MGVLTCSDARVRDLKSNILGTMLLVPATVSLVCGGPYTIYNRTYVFIWIYSTSRDYPFLHMIEQHIVGMSRRRWPSQMFKEHVLSESNAMLESVVHMVKNNVWVDGLISE